MLRFQNWRRGPVVADQTKWTLSDSERRRMSGMLLSAGQASTTQDIALVPHRHDNEGIRARRQTPERLLPTACDLMALLGDLLPTVKPCAALGSAVAAWTIAVTVVLSLFEVISW